MAVHKIVLFYAFTPLADPRAVQLWQRALGECTVCGGATAKYENCADPSCRTLRLYCPGCVHVARSTRCETCVGERPTPVRPL